MGTVRARELELCLQARISRRRKRIFCAVCAGARHGVILDAGKYWDLGGSLNAVNAVQGSMGFLPDITKNNGSAFS